MKKSKCPECGSTSLLIPVTITAKLKYNSDRDRVYFVDKANVCDVFIDSIKCQKCGWDGKEEELT